MLHLGVVDWFQLLGLGGLCGALGQCARTVIGLKKLNDTATSQNIATSDLIDGVRILISLAIGFVAGSLAAIEIFTDLSNITAEQIFAVATAGYAGADFLEGFISRNFSSNSATPGAEDSDGDTSPSSSDGAVG